MAEKYKGFTLIKRGMFTWVLDSDGKPLFKSEDAQRAAQAFDKFCANCQDS